MIRIMAGVLATKRFPVFSSENFVCRFEYWDIVISSKSMFQLLPYSSTPRSEAEMMYYELCIIFVTVERFPKQIQIYNSFIFQPKNMHQKHILTGYDWKQC